MDELLLSPQYVAGLFDGEGWFSIGRQRAKRIRREYSFQLHAALTMREEKIVRALGNQFGGTVIDQKPRSVKHSKAYKWHVNGVSVLGFLDCVEPFLVAKSEQAGIARSFQEEKNRHGNKPLSDEQYRFRQCCFNTMAVLNKKGVGK